ncbi:hypothetical protein LMG27198_34330 [Methylocystis echinoides]|uniref:PI3K/PI4K catalytic domain-containing protein n=1 Tax=Methylocystis echinoides TaxID=29468 RepID=A0A9W6GWX3_9HYPH|nr:hypothetical protein LMG27198_34330 [Methylocystis echinoides]
MTNFNCMARFRLPSVCHDRKDSDVDGNLPAALVVKAEPQKVQKQNRKASGAGSKVPEKSVAIAPRDNSKLDRQARSVSFAGQSTTLPLPMNERNRLQRATSDKNLLNAGQTPPPAKPINWPRPSRQESRTVEKSLLETAGLTESDAKLYRARNISIIGATIADKRADVEIEHLGKGKCSNVYKTSYAEGDGGVVYRAFKPLSNVIKSNGAIASGIELEDPRIAMRNIVVCELAQELGFDVVDPVRVAIRALPEGMEEIGLETKLVTDGIQGDRLVDLLSLEPNIYSNPKIWPGLMQLQLLDALTGQIDRHAGNWFICNVDGVLKIVGIDHDLCFGAEIRHPDDAGQGSVLSNNIMRTGVRGPVFHGVEMPPVVDVSMASAIETLSDARLAEIIGDKLSPAEIASAQTRLTALQGHIAALREKKQVIQPSEWSAPHVRDLLLDEKRPRDDSYILREFKALKQASMITPSDTASTHPSSSHLSFSAASTGALSRSIPEGNGLGGGNFFDSSTKASPAPSSGAPPYHTPDMTKIRTRAKMNEGSPFKSASGDE